MDYDTSNLDIYLFRFLYLYTAKTLTAFTENFSSIPFIASPHLGKAIEGASMAFDLVLSPSVFRNDDDELF
jgi:hypothetical protein